MKITDQEVLKLSLDIFSPLSRLKLILKSKSKTLKKNFYTWVYIPTNIHAEI